jgi:hypothetical protein
MIELLYLVGAIVIVGVLLWGLEQFPLDATLKNVARVLLIVVLVIYAVVVIINLVAGFMGAQPMVPLWRR